MLISGTGRPPEPQVPDTDESGSWFLTIWAVLKCIYHQGRALSSILRPGQIAVFGRQRKANTCKKKKKGKKRVVGIGGRGRGGGAGGRKTTAIRVCDDDHSGVCSFVSLVVDLSCCLSRSISRSGVSA